MFKRNVCVSCVRDRSESHLKTLSLAKYQFLEVRALKISVAKHFKIRRDFGKR